MKTNLLKQLLTCFIAVTIITNYYQVKAEIHYTDIPDTTIYVPNPGGYVDSTNRFYLDLNNDSIYDFCLRARNLYSSGPPELHGTDLGLSAGISNLVSGGCLPPGNTYQIYANDTICNNLVWNSYTYIRFEETYLPWECYIPTGDAFYGLKLVVDNDTLFGWVRLSATETSITIKDYAYNDIPNEPILAGQISTNIDTNSLNENISIYFNDNNLFIDITDINYPEGTVTVSNSSGQVVLNSIIQGSNTVIELNNISTGIYIVIVDIQEGLLTKKVFI